MWLQALKACFFIDCLTGVYLVLVRLSSHSTFSLDNNIAQIDSPPASASYDLAHLYVEVTGPDNADPVLLLHGWASSAENMRAIATGLSGNYQVYNVDLPGHGRSPEPSVPMGVPEHARLIFTLIRHTIEGPVSIIGHSNGGRIALYMASDAEMKHAIRRLVLVSPSGIAPKRQASYYIKSYAAKVLKWPFEMLPEPLRALGLDWLRHSLVWKLLGSSDYRDLQGIMRETFVRLVTHHVDDRLSMIEVPTLLVWGSNDSAISQRQMRVLEEKIPDAGLVVLEGSGHYGYLEDYDTFIAATRHFLENS